MLKLALALLAILSFGACAHTEGESQSARVDKRISALVDADDQHHASCVAALKKLQGPMGTVWPAVTEAMYLLSDLPAAQDAVWDMIARGAVELLHIDLSDTPRIRELMRKYVDRPMDLADAALVRIAERESIRKIFTIDRKDFPVYRLHGKRRFTLIP